MTGILNSREEQGEMKAWNFMELNQSCVERRRREVVKKKALILTTLHPQIPESFPFIAHSIS